MENQKAKTFYHNLRDNIINTVCGNFRDTGYFFEHYNQDLDGKGRGNHPFSKNTQFILIIFYLRWMDFYNYSNNIREILI